MYIHINVASNIPFPFPVPSSHYLSSEGMLRPCCEISPTSTTWAPCAHRAAVRLTRLFLR